MSNKEEMEHIKVLSFDLDDTLWDCIPVLERAYATEKAHMELHYPKIADQINDETIRGFMIDIAKTNPEVSHSMTSLRKMALGRVVQEYGDKNDDIDHDHFVESTFDAFIRERCNVGDHVFPNIIPSLRKLQDKGYILVSVTNGNCDIARVPDFDGIFQHSIRAEEVGALKPDPRVFQRILELTNAKPHEVLHVGDSMDHDVIGAQKFGMKTVWVTRNPATRSNLQHDDNNADYVLECASHLPNLFE